MEVKLELTDNIALITLDDGKKNAITLDALHAINACLDEADEKAEALVIAGRPGSFCAGFNLATMTGGDVNLAEAFEFTVDDNGNSSATFSVDLKNM